MEELIAELGTVFLAAKFWPTPEMRDDHAAHIGTWRKVVMNNKPVLFSAPCLKEFR